MNLTFDVSTYHMKFQLAHRVQCWFKKQKKLDDQLALRSQPWEIYVIVKYWASPLLNKPLKVYQKINEPFNHQYDFIIIKPQFVHWVKCFFFKVKNKSVLINICRLIATKIMTNQLAFLFNTQGNKGSSLFQEWMRQNFCAIKCYTTHTCYLCLYNGQWGWKTLNYYW